MRQKPIEQEEFFIETQVKAPINKIIPLSVVDGPGARSAVFLQGCNIACKYCHNPETQRLCIHCGICVPTCPVNALTLDENADGTQTVLWDIKKCINCDTCINVCPHFASPRIQWLTAQEVIDILSPSTPFIRGITCSGGECTLYPEFLESLFSLAREQGLSTLIDSNGMVPLSNLPRLMSVTDGVMLDVKAWDRTVYESLTGAGSNETVKHNLKWLSDNDKLAELRIVVKSGFVDAEAILMGIANTLGSKTTSETNLKLIRFRPNGVRGEMAQLQATSLQELQSLSRKANDLGFQFITQV